jgi:quinol-cytochrome oxidoreductase complex cytochrome b subunit
VPEWYFLPFYAILRSIPDKFGGVIAMFAAIIILFFLPYVGTFKCKSSKFLKVAQFFF